MLSEKDYSRIVKEIDQLRGENILEYLRRTSPWFDLLEPSLRRMSRILSDLGMTHVLYGLRPLPLYGVPYLSREIRFAAMVEKRVDELLNEASRRGFMKLSSPEDRAVLLDSQYYSMVEVFFKPVPLEWSRELMSRVFERHGVKLLSPEDYAIGLIAGSPSIAHLELAAKVIYANIESIDLGLLRENASKHGLSEIVDEILKGLKGASNRL